MSDASMSARLDRDYILGTHDEELARLGLQHRVWRERMLEGWRRAGITHGWRVLDVGAGPGYATLDLAELVGPTGEVIAVERSARFLEHARESCRQRGFTNVQFHELDLMQAPVAFRDLDATWCRWVTSFVSSPATLVSKIAAVLRPGGVAIFHEYVDYQSWRITPHGALHEQFVNEVMASWRASGGEPDAARELPQLLVGAGFKLKHVAPAVLAVRPPDFEWQWPKTFIEINLLRLVELGRVKADWTESVREALRTAEADPATVMITPMFLEIIAERVPTK